MSSEATKLTPVSLTVGVCVPMQKARHLCTPFQTCAEMTPPPPQAPGSGAQMHTCKNACRQRKSRRLRTGTTRTRRRCVCTPALPSRLCTHTSTAPRTQCTCSCHLYKCPRFCRAKMRIPARQHMSCHLFWSHNQGCRHTHGARHPRGCTLHEGRRSHSQHASTDSPLPHNDPRSIHLCRCTCTCPPYLCTLRRSCTAKIDTHRRSSGSGGRCTPAYIRN